MTKLTRVDTISYRKSGRPAIDSPVGVGQVGGADDPDVQVASQKEHVGVVIAVCRA